MPSSYLSSLCSDGPASTHSPVTRFLSIGLDPGVTSMLPYYHHDTLEYLAEAKVTLTKCVPTAFLEIISPSNEHMETFQNE